MAVLHRLTARRTLNQPWRSRVGAAFAIAGGVSLLMSLAAPWALGYGPGVPGFAPLQRPILFGQLNAEFLLVGGAVAALVSGAYGEPRWRSWLRVAAFAGGFLPWVYLGMFILDPSALGGSALPGSGFLPATGFWIAAVGCICVVVSSWLDLPLASNVDQRDAARSAFS